MATYLEVKLSLFYRKSQNIAFLSEVVKVLHYVTRFPSSKYYCKQELCKAIK